MLGFIIGFMMGSLFGVITLALAQAAKEGDDHDWTDRRGE